MRFFVNVYRNGLNCVHPSREQAEMAAFPGAEMVELEAPVRLGEEDVAGRSAAQLRARYPLSSCVSSPVQTMKLTLPTDSEERKQIQLLAAFLNYIPAAARKFAEHSKAGNDKHNKGQPVHHARWKSTDHEECMLRHLMDIQDIRAYIRRNGATPQAVKMLLSEAAAEFWRAGVFLQQLCEEYEGAPVAPGARLQGDPI